MDRGRGYIYKDELSCYKVERSFEGIELGPLKSPFRLRPGPFVELRTCHENE